jgi:hypothetical protein
MTNAHLGARRRRPATAGRDRLSSTALNRATLARQHLLRRSDQSVPAAVEGAVGVNAQTPNAPYYWLWARVAGFEIAQLTAAIESRQVVRSTMMRGTQHLVGAADFRWLRPVLQPLLERLQRGTFGRRTAGIDPAAIAAAARELLAGRTMTRPDLGRLLDDRWPGRERGALAWSAQYLEPVLHPAPSGTWNTLGTTPFVLATDWLGDLDPVPAPERMVRRYLAAYGPATVADIRAWSGVSGLREVVDGMGGELRTFLDEAGRVLLDLPDAARPCADTPAPVRFLAEFDNLLLAYADRSRVMSADVRRQVCVGDGVAPTVLVDGTVAGTWTLSRNGDGTTLRLQPLRRWTRAERTAVDDEAVRVLGFAASGGDCPPPHEVRVLAAAG